MLGALKRGEAARSFFASASASCNKSKASLSFSRPRRVAPDLVPAWAASCPSASPSTIPSAAISIRSTMWSASTMKLRFNKLLAFDARPNPARDWRLRADGWIPMTHVQPIRAH